MTTWLQRFVCESNAIEGIHREPMAEEIAEAERFIDLRQVTIVDLVHFVSVYQPNALLRERSGLNVRVGNHIAPRGGPAIPRDLQAILDNANDGAQSPCEIHHLFETLHPFSDGNGRSGRMLFAWQMERDGNHALHVRPFLHEWYYQCLGARRWVSTRMR